VTRAVALLIASGLFGCSASVTEVIVVSDTDLAVPGSIDHVRIAVTGPDALVQDAVADLGGGAPRPVTVGLVSRSGGGALDIVVTGERNGVVVVARTGHAAFVTGRVVAVRMDLWSRCVGVTCSATQTCGDAGCRSVEIAEGELVPWTGMPPSTAIDGGGVADTGGADTGLPIGDCTTPAQCDDGFTCTLDDCVMGHCTHQSRDVACDDGLACTTEHCDASVGCVYVADDTACSDGVACTHDVCDRLMGCVATPDPTVCPSGSTCNVTLGCVGGPRFADVYASVVQVSCTPCHTSSPVSGGLDMRSEATAYASLVGVTATCGGGANTRVIPRDPMHSLLWRKVAGVDLCGARMPRLRTPLDQASIDLIANWIAAGAVP